MFYCEWQYTNTMQDILLNAASQQSYIQMNENLKFFYENCSYPAPINDEVTTASPGWWKRHVRLKRLSRPVCTLSANCTITIFVIESPN